MAFQIESIDVLDFTIEFLEMRGNAVPALALTFGLFIERSSFVRGNESWASSKPPVGDLLEFSCSS